MTTSTSQKKPYPSIRLFESSFFEVFSHVHPIIPVLLWGPFVIWSMWKSFAVEHVSFGMFAALGALGLLVWTLTEYGLHRFLFHFDARTALSKRFVFIFHGIHHADPADPTRLVMPPIVSIALALILYNLFKAILGPSYVFAFFAFFIIGYLSYDYIHFGIHHYQPKSRVGKWIKQNHMLHHFVTPEARWGVSSPLWDYILGTVEEKKPIQGKSAEKEKKASRPSFRRAFFSKKKLDKERSA